MDTTAIVGPSNAQLDAWDAHRGDDHSPYRRLEMADYRRLHDLRAHTRDRWAQWGQPDAHIECARCIRLAREFGESKRTGTPWPG